MTDHVDAFRVLNDQNRHLLVQVTVGLLAWKDKCDTGDKAFDELLQFLVSLLESSHPGTLLPASYAVMTGGSPCNLQVGSGYGCYLDNI